MEVSTLEIQKQIDSIWKLFFSIHRNSEKEAFYTNTSFLHQMVSSHVVTTTATTAKDFFAGFDLEPKKEEIKEETDNSTTPTTKKRKTLNNEQKKEAFGKLLEMWNEIN